jgi:uncharacterized protein (DUF2062 family)
MNLRFDLKGFVRRSFERLHQIRDAPHAVAGGVAVGIFWGFSPLTGLKTLLSLGTAWGLRFSRIAAVIAVSLHDVLLPLWPVILRWEYQLGYWIFSHPHRFPPKLVGHLLHWDNLFTARMATVLWKTCVGSVIIGLPFALLTYWLTLVLLARYEAKHHVHLKPPP